MSNDNRFGPVIDYHGQRPCNDPMVLGRLMDRLCEGRAPTLTERISKALADLRKKLTR